MNATYTIYQRVAETGHHEPIPNAEFDTWEEACVAAHTLAGIWKCGASAMIIVIEVDGFKVRCDV